MNEGVYHVEVPALSQNISRGPSMVERNPDSQPMQTDRPQMAAGLDNGAIPGPSLSRPRNVTIEPKDHWLHCYGRLSVIRHRKSLNPHP